MYFRIIFRIQTGLETELLRSRTPVRKAGAVPPARALLHRVGKLTTRTRLVIRTKLERHCNVSLITLGAPCAGAAHQGKRYAGLAGASFYMADNPAAFSAEVDSYKPVRRMDSSWRP